MAVRARGGSPGAIAALVTFVVLFFAAVIVSVLYYVQARGLEHKLEAAQNELAEAISGPDRSELAGLRPRGGQSIVGMLLEQRSWCFAALTGNAKAEFEAVQAAVKDVGLAEGQPLVAELRQLRQQLAAAEQLQQQQQQALAAMTAQLKQVQQQKGEQQVVFAKSVEELGGQVKQQSAQFADYQQRVQQNLQELRDAISQSQGRYQQMVQELEQKVAQLSADNAGLRKKIQELVPKASGEGPVVDPSLLPDGQIMAVEPSGRWVYINRGRNHHLVLGMTFEVFSDVTSIAAADQARGKASIKVVEILADSAKCLVTRVATGKSVTEGDLIVNVAYSPDATFNFFVFGDFDLDNRGQASPQDARRVREMLESWGGKVVPTLTYDTDFVVLGRQPPEPPAITNEIDPVQIAKAVRARQLYDEYQRLVQQARELSVPILNQTRFLTLVGYYER